MFIRLRSHTYCDSLRLASIVQPIFVYPLFYTEFTKWFIHLKNMFFEWNYYGLTVDGFQFTSFLFSVRDFPSALIFWNWESLWRAQFNGNIPSAPIVLKLETKVCCSVAAPFACICSSAVDVLASCSRVRSSTGHFFGELSAQREYHWVT